MKTTLVECCDCEGSGECPYCIGDPNGKEDSTEYCEYCSGTGKCTLCQGKGKRQVMSTKDALSIVPALAYTSFKTPFE